MFSKLCLTMSCFLIAAPAAAVERAVLDAFAVEILESIQTRSIRRNREFCGYLGVDPGGVLRATTPRSTARDGCEIVPLPGDWTVLASYHSHGAFTPVANAELPSTYDVVSDGAEGIFGYIGTPGGRVWFVDGPKATATLLCGPGCISVDPGYDAGVFGPLAESYTLEELEDAENAGALTPVQGTRPPR
ncbi:MAG: DUF4329 domain-containing protein [Pseudomonadota bacterium]